MNFLKEMDRKGVWVLLFVFTAMTLLLSVKTWIENTGKVPVSEKENMLCF